MNQDANKIIDVLSAEWSQDMATAKRKIAILAEENRLLKEELDKDSKKANNAE